MFTSVQCKATHPHNNKGGGLEEDTGATAADLPGTQDKSCSLMPICQKAQHGCESRIWKCSNTLPGLGDRKMGHCWSQILSLASRPPRKGSRSAFLAKIFVLILQVSHLIENVVFRLC